MAEQRAGALPTETVATDPFGSLQRGVALREGRYHRHVLLRAFSEELRDAGLGAKLDHAGPMLLRLGGIKAYEGFRVEGGAAPSVSCPYVPGRSLAQVLAKVRKGVLPLSLDSALALVWSLAQELGKLHALDLPHGLLSPHSAWVSFEGVVQLLDAPLAGFLRELLPRAPGLRAALAPYDAPAGLSGPDRDLWQLGALLYELLALEPPPAASHLRRAVEALSAGPEDAREPLPRELRSLLHRLLGSEPRFSDFAAFNQELERVLFDGEHVPTTFGLAFFMHGLFAQELREEEAAMKAEREADHFSRTAAGARLRNQVRAGLDSVQAPPRARSRAWLGVGAGALAAIGLGYVLLSHREGQLTELRGQLASYERQSAELMTRQSDLDAKTREEAASRARIEQLAAARDEATRAEAQHQLEEAQRRQAALDQQQARLEDERRHLAEARAALERQAPKATPEAPRPALAAALPAPVQDQAPALVSPLGAVLPAGFSGASARVRLRVFVNEQGRAQKVLVLDGDPALLDAAQQAAMNARYSPALHAGAPSRDWLTLNVGFTR